MAFRFLPSFCSPWIGYPSYLLEGSASFQNLLLSSSHKSYEIQAERE